MPVLVKYGLTYFIDHKSLLDNGFEINGNIIRFDIEHMTNDAMLNLMS